MADYWRMRFFCSLLIVISSAHRALASDVISTLNLVSGEAAFCLEVPHLDQTWRQVESSPLIKRIRELPAYQRLLECSSFQQWQATEKQVAAHTGSKMSAQLRALFGNSLVLAIYIPESGQPGKGILIGEAIDLNAVSTALSTWNLVEPHDVVTTKTFQGQKYQARQRPGTRREHLYYATTGRWVAVSDHEELIQDVIQRYLALSKSSGRSPVSPSLAETNQFQQSRQKLKPNAAAYVYINARPWDRGLQESVQNEDEPINPAKIWKRVRSVSAGLDLNLGSICDAVIDLDPSNQPADWPPVVSTASKDADWDLRIPDDALMAVSGRLEVASFLNKLLKQTPQQEQAELARNRRIAQSLLGGNELFAEVLPMLARDFCGSVALSAGDSTNRFPLDGSISFKVNSPGDEKAVQQIAHGFETGLRLLAAYFSIGSQSVVTVQREQNETSQLSWLSSAAPIPVSLGVTQQTLVVAGSRERLRRMLDSSSNRETPSRLKDHSQRYFPQANQLIWLDTVQIRQALSKSGRELALQLARGSADEAKRFEDRFQRLQPYLSLMDSFFVAGRIEADTIRITFGGGLDSK